MAMETGRLAFWRAKRGKQVRPATIYRQLQREVAPAQLEAVAVEPILAELRRQYSNIELGEGAGELDLPGEQAAVELTWSDRHVEGVFFGEAYGLMDRLARLMRKFDLVCYDVGLKQLFGADDPLPFLGSPVDQVEVQAFRDVTDKAVRDIHAENLTPQERIAKLKAMLDSGQLRNELDARRGELREERGKPKG